MDRETDRTKSEVLVELSNGLLVFNNDYLIKCIPELNQLSPEQVVVENAVGAIRDFGHGAYLFAPSVDFDGTVEFRCVVEGVPITASCDLYPLQKAASIVAPKVPLIDTLPTDIGSFSILADNSLLITHQQLWALLGLTPQQAQGFKIQNVTAKGEEYQAKLSPQFCLLYRHQAVYSGQISPLPKTASLEIQLVNHVSGDRYHHQCHLDLHLFHHLFVTPLASNTSTHHLRQTDLLRSASELSSPILFIESVFSMESQQTLLAQENGSFKLPQSERHLMYTISDAIDIVAMGVVIPSQVSSRRATQPITQKKWCDIEVSKQDLLSSTDLDNLQRLNSVSYQYCDWVKVVTESDEQLRLRSHSVDSGVGKLSLSASEDRATEGYLSFELVFMPNLVFHRCVKERGEHQWQVSTREIETLIAKRSKKRIQHLDINCNSACVTMSDADTCTLWTTQWCDKVRLNLTLTFEDGSLGFSSINI